MSCMTKEMLLHEICLIINNDQKMLQEIRRIKALADRLPQGIEIHHPIRRWLVQLRQLEGKAWRFMKSCYEEGELPYALPCFHWNDIFEQTYCDAT